MVNKYRIWAGSSCKVEEDANRTSELGYALQSSCIQLVVQDDRCLGIDMRI